MKATFVQMALLYITFVVTDDLLSAKYLLIGHPVLSHMVIDSRTMFERNYENLYGTDCSGLEKDNLLTH